MRKLASLTLLILICVSISVSAHPGSLDENGGHWNRKTGEYHYHDGTNTGSGGFSSSSDIEYNNIIIEEPSIVSPKDSDNYIEKDVNDTIDNKSSVAVFKPTLIFYAACLSIFFTLFSILSAVCVGIYIRKTKGATSLFNYPSIQFCCNWCQFNLLLSSTCIVCFIVFPPSTALFNFMEGETEFLVALESIVAPLLGIPIVYFIFTLFPRIILKFFSLDADNIVFDDKLYSVLFETISTIFFLEFIIEIIVFHCYYLIAHLITLILVIYIAISDPKRKKG